MANIETKGGQDGLSLPPSGKPLLGRVKMYCAVFSFYKQWNSAWALQASLSSLSVVSGLGGVSMYLSVYGATVDIFRGLIFVIVSALFIVIAALLGVVHFTHRDNDNDEEEFGYGELDKSDSS
ncbi:hypothetical protein CAPTEDRAFT_198738 [Capitella teleta]|uniref:Uncharacterized protein n=1 Tax=Capitella teleta TaxID=283909 RepID=R7V9A0_CAPTE|nr:hypothetical protein CAPTEDRAFT_198738 [Capitella teleta]|eukprot:ELU12936.1 hypothetical protein CAPTEDRAFT_198738 [Capitella teleta]